MSSPSLKMGLNLQAAPCVSSDHYPTRENDHTRFSIRYFGSQLKTFYTILVDGILLLLHLHSDVVTALSYSRGNSSIFICPFHSFQGFSERVAHAPIK